MSARYRLIHFTPDPFTGLSFPLGALIQDAGGTFAVVKAKLLPSAELLGSRSLAVSLRRLHGRLDRLSSFDELPEVFGPMTTLGELQEVPEAVANPLGWVQSLFFESERSPSLRTPRGVRRASLGYRFFETWKVARHVRKAFRPARSLDGWIHGQAPGLQTLSHWVAGRDQVLLMEPVVPTRPQLLQDLRDISTRFGAYRYALERVGSSPQGQLVAYITGGGTPERRALAKETLSAFAHLVVDTVDAAERARFLALIREVAAENPKTALQADRPPTPEG